MGRGCLFGPVFAAAVVLPAAALEPLQRLGLTDSKALSAGRRAALVPAIQHGAEAWALGQASAAEIDRLGIRAATELAMLRALHKLAAAPELLIVDGVLPLRGWGGVQATMAKGDRLCPAIAAASVVAKQARDHLVHQLAARYPGYGLERHVGYGTPQHRAALLQLGVTPLHRRSFLTRWLGVDSGGTSAGNPPPPAGPPGP